jgi:putative ABC transport system permease protein
MDKSRSEMKYLYVKLANYQAVPIVQSLLFAMLKPVNSQDIKIMSADASGIQAGIEQSMGGFANFVLIMVLGLGIVLISAVTLIEALMNQKDIGRRRALGASKFYISALLVVRGIVVSTAGVFIGVSVATVYLYNAYSAIPGSFLAAVGALVILIGSIGSVIPSLILVNKDPLRAIRTP